METKVIDTRYLCDRLREVESKISDLRIEQDNAEIERSIEINRDLSSLGYKRMSLKNRILTSSIPGKYLPREIDI